jgi:hypothetical protein
MQLSAKISARGILEQRVRFLNATFIGASNLIPAQMECFAREPRNSYRLLRDTKFEQSQ